MVLKKYQLYGGAVMAFYCKYCGRKYTDIKYMLTCSCSKSPTKKHNAYEGNHTDPFICKHCGRSYDDPQYMLTCSCSKSPTKYHELL